MSLLTQVKKKEYVIIENDNDCVKICILKEPLGTVLFSL